MDFSERIVVRSAGLFAAVNLRVLINEILGASELGRHYDAMIAKAVQYQIEDVSLLERFDDPEQEVVIANQIGLPDFTTSVDAAKLLLPEGVCTLLADNGEYSLVTLHEKGIGETGWWGPQVQHPTEAAARTIAALV